MPLRYSPAGPALTHAALNPAVRWPERTVLLLMLGGCFLVFGVYITFEGSFIPTLAVPITLTIAILSVYRLDWGVTGFLGMVLLFDQHELRGLETLTYDLRYFHNLNQTPYVPPGSSLVISPMELHLCFLVAVWFAMFALDSRYRFRPVSLWPLLVMLAGWLLFAFLHGQATGGEYLMSIWEVRALAYFTLIYVLLPQVITTYDQVRAVIWVVMGVMLLKIGQAMGRFVGQGFNFGGAELLTNQEDPVLMAAFILFWGVMFLSGVKDRQKNFLTLALLPLLFGIYLSQRRAAYVSLAISIIVLGLFVEGKHRRLYLRCMLWFAILFSIYLALYWNTHGRIGMIAQQVKSTLAGADPDGADYLSNVYRDYENYNLAVTVQRSPLIGLGFGHKYDTPMLMYKILEHFAILQYIPHNSILWLAAKTGFVGIFILFLFLNGVIFRTAHYFRKISDPYLKAVAVLCIFGILNQMITSYVEMQLSYYRSMIIMSCMAALPAILMKIDRERTAARTPVAADASSVNGGNA